MADQNQTAQDLEAALFAFLTRKYVQRQDGRQRAIGLVYMEAETHNLARELARFMMPPREAA